MLDKWRGLMLLLVVPWLTNCVTRPGIRLDTGQGPSIVYTPPTSEPPPVELRQEEFVEALTNLVLHIPLTLSPPQWERQVELASWEGSRDVAQRILTNQYAPLEIPDDRLLPPRNAPPPETLARMRLALSFSMDTVWEGAAVPISEVVDPLAFKLMVYTAMCTYLLSLMMPEPVTKGLSAVLTVVLVAYLGLGPVWSMVKAGWQMLHDCEQATTTGELRQNGKVPDYKLNGEYADCMSPSTPNARNIASRIKLEKIGLEQTDRIILNLEDSSVTIEAMTKQLLDWPIPGLKQVIAIKDGKVIPIFP